MSPEPITLSLRPRLSCSLPGEPQKEAVGVSDPLPSPGSRAPAARWPATCSKGSCGGCGTPRLCSSLRRARPRLLQPSPSRKGPRCSLGGDHSSPHGHGSRQAARRRGPWSGAERTPGHDSSDGDTHSPRASQGRPSRLPSFFLVSTHRKWPWRASLPPAGARLGAWPREPSWVAFLAGQLAYLRPRGESTHIQVGLSSQ